MPFLFYGRGGDPGVADYFEFWDHKTDTLSESTSTVVTPGTSPFVGDEVLTRTASYEK